MKILVTGATGFIGQHLCSHLRQQGHLVRPVGRKEVGAVDRTTNWQSVLDDVDTVVHLAGRAHVMREKSKNPIDLYRECNLYGTAALVEQAEAAGVKRFVFASSIKVLGEESTRPFTAQDEPQPVDAYGVSKAEAEDAVKELKGAMEHVIIRPPLVYGPNVKGNFRSLLGLAGKGWPLPLGGIENARSLIYVGNLVSAFEAALTCPSGTYMPSDREDLSTSALVSRLAQAFGKPARLFAVPPALLTVAGLAAGRRSAVQRLVGSLTVDGYIPDWEPPYSVDEGLQATVSWYSTLRR